MTSTINVDGRGSVVARDSSVQTAQAPSTGASLRQQRGGSVAADLPPPQVTNWNAKITSRPTAVYTPTREIEIIDIIRREKQVRVGGGMHSFNGGLSAEGVAFINMANFNDVSQPKPNGDGTWTVWVQAGATVKDVSTKLHKYGLALENLPTSESITIGGAIANGAHGSGLTSRAVLAEQVVGMEIITSDGEKKVIEEKDLPLYRIHLGSLGVVTNVQLRAVPDFDLMYSDDKQVGEHDIVAALEPSRLRREVSSYQSVMYIIDPNLRDPSKTSLVRWGLTKVTDANRDKAKDLIRKQTYETRGQVDNFRVFQAFEAAAKATGEQASAIKAAIRSRFQPHNPPMVGRSGLMYTYLLNHPVRDVSYAVPFEKAQETFVLVMKKMRELGYEASIPMSMRFLRGTNETLLGVNSGRDVAIFEVTNSVLFDDPNSGAIRPDVKAAHEAFEAIMIAQGGRPHWGKEFSVSAKDRHSADAWERYGRESLLVGKKLVNDWAVAMTPARKG